MESKNISVDVEGITYNVGNELIYIYQSLEN